MEILLLLKALLLGIVEGLTEFLPISSTGHLIITSDLINFDDDVFEIVIQFAAILAVCWAYRMRLTELVTGVLFKPRSRLSLHFVFMLILAFLPAAVLGLAFHRVIKEVLFNPIVVAAALIVGGLIIFYVERPGSYRPRNAGIDDITAGDAIKIGFAQALAMIPGTSRSGATIIGGVIFGLSRTAATEFSFFLAIPTMFAATVLDVYKSWDKFTSGDTTVYAVYAIGCIASFLSAVVAVRFLLRFISSHTFVSFAWYRIALGVIVLATWQFGWVDWKKAAEATPPAISAPAEAEATAAPALDVPEPVVDAVAPDDAAATPDDAATALDDAATAPDDATTAPDDAATAPDDAAAAPPTLTKPEPQTN
jgi:undecaprenyl-diphosphatase